MPIVNVFTHYTHKVAWQKLQRQERMRRLVRRLLRHSVWLKAAVFGGLPCGLLAWSAPGRELAAITAAGAAWGVILALLRERSRKVSGALKGQPLEADDLPGPRSGR